MEAKKTPKADLGRKYGLFFNIGLLVSVSLVLAAFEHKSYTNWKPLELDPEDTTFEDVIIDIPITSQPPPKPPVEQPIIEEIPNEIEIEEKIEVIFDVPEETAIKEVVLVDVPIEEKADEIHDFAEKMPEFPGGMEAWAKFLNKNLKYPTQARRMGIEGTVYLVFIVNTDGSIQDVEILRGVDGGLSEEAVRVIKKAPNWKPGLQGGRPVRVKMRLPVRFKLS